MKLIADQDIEFERNVEFSDMIYWNDHRQLACPACGDGYLHHDAVDVFERLRGEDGDSFRFHLEGNRLETSVVGDAPGRRNSIEVRFYCENCSLADDGRRTHFFVLQIIQHKGCTYISWVRAYSNETAYFDTVKNAKI